MTRRGSLPQSSMVTPSPQQHRASLAFSSGSPVPSIVAVLVPLCIFGCSSLFAIGQSVTMFSLGRSATVNFVSFETWNTTMRPTQQLLQATEPSLKMQSITVCEDHDADIAEGSAAFGASFLTNCAQIKSYGICDFDPRLEVTCCVSCGFGPPTPPASNFAVTVGIESGITNNSSDYMAADTSASTDIMVGSSEQEIYQMKPFMPMSFMLSMQQLWETKEPSQQSISVLIFLLSGIWPHLKLLLVTLCWCIPMQLNTRGRILALTSKMGKFSLVDPLVIMLIMAVFTTGYTLHRDSSPDLFPKLAQAVTDDMDFKLDFNATEMGLEEAEVLQGRMNWVHVELGMYAWSGVLYFCGGVWASLLIGAVVEHYALSYQEKQQKQHEREQGEKSAELATCAGTSIVLVLLLLGFSALPVFTRDVGGSWGVFLHEAESPSFNLSTALANSTNSTTNSSWVYDPEAHTSVDIVDFHAISDFIFDAKRGNSAFLGVTWLVYCTITPILYALALSMNSLRMAQPSSSSSSRLSTWRACTTLLPGLDALVVFLLCCIVVLVEVGKFTEVLPLGFCTKASFGIFDHVTLSDCQKMDIGLGSGFYVLCVATLLSYVLSHVLSEQPRDEEMAIPPMTIKILEAESEEGANSTKP